MERLAGDSLTVETLREALAVEAPSSSQLIDTIARLSSRAMASGGGATPRYDDLEPWIESPDDNGRSTLGGYELLECIGRGGMGVVFRAQDRTADRVVALKVMLPELARDDRARDRFLREARAIATVRHPNVVALYDVSEVDGLPYLVMEYVGGGSLQDRMRDGEPMVAAEIVRIGAAVAAALTACHEHGVVHRDIKPSNVLLGETGDGDEAIRVSDFGLAAVASTPTLTHHGFLSGTPDYVAPERLSIGAAPDERSDLFSLGCLLYTMASGREPFGGDTPLITLHRIATDNPAPLRVENPAIPAHLEKAIASLMAKRPEDRPASASVARALLLENAQVGRSAWRQPGAWVGGLLLVTVVLAVVLYAVLRSPAPSGVGPPTAIVVTTADELLDAVASVQDDGWIVLDTDATLVVPPLYIAWKSVTIAAADGRRPTIQLEVTDEGPAPEYLLRLYYGTLNLSGLRLQDDWRPSEHLPRVGSNRKAAEQFALLSLIDADLFVERCRFETRTIGAGVKLDPGNEAVLRDTQVFAPEGTAISWHAIDNDGLLLGNCVIVGNVGLLTALEGDAEIRWQGSTVLANVAALELNPVRGRLTAWVSDCVIQSMEALVVASIDPPSLDEFKRTLAWHGEGNRIRGREVRLSDGEYAPSWAQELTGWAIGDADSVYRQQLFSVPHAEAVNRLMSGEPVEDLALDRVGR
ncbi:MAG: serine/threonine-protein kinase [Planctomycetota bacterium]